MGFAGAQPSYSSTAHLRPFSSPPPRSVGIIAIPELPNCGDISYPENRRGCAEGQASLTDGFCTRRRYDDSHPAERAIQLREEILLLIRARSGGDSFSMKSAIE